MHTLQHTLTLCLWPGQAKNLLKAGFEVTVRNRTPERCAPLRDAGAAVAATAGEAAAASDLTFATLSTPDAARAVGAEVARSIRAGARPASKPRFAAVFRHSNVCLRSNCPLATLQHCWAWGRPVSVGHELCANSVQRDLPPPHVWRYKLVRVAPLG